MALATQPPMTPEEFDRWALLPQNRDRRLEFIDGEVVELVTPSDASKIASRISGYIFVYLQQNDIGELTGADGGYIVAGARYIPDVAFIRYARQTHPAAAYYPVAPDLAVEVISNPDNAQELHDLRRKVSNYLSAGTVVWVVEREARTVEVHTPGQPVSLLGGDAALSGDAVLPGFMLKVADIFPPQAPAE